MWKILKHKYFTHIWNPFYSILLIAVLSAYYFGITGSAWAVTGEFTRWGGEIVHLFGIDTSSWEYFQIIGLEGNIFTRKDGVMIIGMFLGALISSLLANHFRLRLPQTKTRIFQALIGGIIAGFGARLGMGCNLASFFTGIPQFSLHAWFFTIMSIIGIYVGTKIVKFDFYCSRIILKENCDSKNTTKNQPKILFFLGIFIFFLSLIYIAFLLWQDTHSSKVGVLGIATLFGLIFGFIISRAQICFTSAFRDLFLAGKGDLAKAIVLGMFLSTLGVFGFILLGVPPKIIWAGPNVIIGGFLFGFGIILAGGCECGWMYRAMEGQIHYIIVGVGNLIGSVLLAYTWPLYAQSFAKNFPKINLLESFGNYGGLLMNYFLLILLLLFVFIVEKRTKSCNKLI